METTVFTACQCPASILTHRLQETVVELSGLVILLSSGRLQFDRLLSVALLSVPVPFPLSDFE